MSCEFTPRAGNRGSGQKEAGQHAEGTTGAERDRHGQESAAFLILAQGAESRGGEQSHSRVPS